MTISHIFWWAYLSCFIGGNALGLRASSCDSRCIGCSSKYSKAFNRFHKLGLTRQGANGNDDSSHDDLKTSQDNKGGIPVSSAAKSEFQTERSDPLKLFVPGFVLAWAIGYSVISILELQGGGLGDLGGYFAAGFAFLLLFGIVGAAVWESFR
jgi:hypothetical protein